MVQVAYDPEWRAQSGSAALAIHRDALGQMLIETPPGSHDIRMRFDTPFENRAGQLFSLLAAIIVMGLVVLGVRKGGGPLKRLAIPSGLIAAGLFALNVALNVPLFFPGEMPYRDSIEGGYASMARFFWEHPSPWGWNPAQYCGLPAQFTSLPGLPYLAAAMSRLIPAIPPDYGYRILASLFACLGPATLFFFVLYFTRSRGWALAVALAYTFYSPLYYFVPAIDRDRGIAYLPWRLQVLMKYGEGPHNLGLTLIPLALVSVWRAGVGKGFRSLFAAALLLAAVALTNWIAALALAFCCLMLLVTLWGSFLETGFRASRVFEAAALGYGLACFWLTPSFIGVIAFNWPKDAFNYHFLRQQALLLAALPIVVLLLRLLLARLFHANITCGSSRSRFSDSPGWCFVSTRPASIPFRNPAATRSRWRCFWRCWSSRFSGRPLRAPIVPLRFFTLYAMLVIFLSSWGQATEVLRRKAFASAGRRRRRVRSSVARRNGLRHCSPGAACSPPVVFASGSIPGSTFRKWAAVSNPDLTTRMPLNLSYQIRTGVNSTPEREGQDAIRELKNLGAEYVVVHGRSLASIIAITRIRASSTACSRWSGTKRTTPSTAFRSRRWHMR